MKDGNALVGRGAGRSSGAGLRASCGIRFIPDGSGGVEESRPLLNAARRALAREIPERLARLEAAPDAAFALSAAGVVSWEGAPVGRLTAGEAVTRPRVDPLQSDLLDSAQRERLRRRLALWAEHFIARRLKPLTAAAAAPVTGATRGVLFQLIEALGLLPRRELSAQLPLADTKALGVIGACVGRETVWFPALASSGSAGGAALVHPCRPGADAFFAAAPAAQPAARSRLAGGVLSRRAIAWRARSPWADALEQLSRPPGGWRARVLPAGRGAAPARAMRAAALPAVIAALGYFGRGEGELRFYAPDRKAGAKRQAPARSPAAAGFPFAALRDLKFTMRSVERASGSTNGSGMRGSARAALAIKLAAWASSGSPAR
jgi:ATP-dependent RNA helicase SUPV3L1/SUV3